MKFTNCEFSNYDDELRDNSYNNPSEMDIVFHHLHSTMEKLYRLSIPKGLLYEFSLRKFNFSVESW